MKRNRMVAMVATVGALVAGAIGAGNAWAIILAENGHWCGIDAPQRISGLQTYLYSHENNQHYTSCAQAQTHVFDRYKHRSSKIVRFQISQHKFLKEMFVGDRKWIGSADIGDKPNYRASENGHDVEGTFISDFDTYGTVRLNGQEGWYYAIWIQ